VGVPLSLTPKEEWEVEDFCGLQRTKKRPKERPFFFSFIDQVLDSLAWKKLLSFVDGFSGNNQIKINP